MDEKTAGVQRGECVKKNQLPAEENTEELAIRGCMAQKVLEVMQERWSRKPMRRSAGISWKVSATPRSPGKGGRAAPLSINSAAVRWTG